MTKVTVIIYEAFLEALKDGAIAEASVLSQELDGLAESAQVISKETYTIG